ncbi:unnamed protein product [Cuscuta europaea]|uniref:Uncharacterized protein n=1 Tax=Cuscuta europaea TaxID=41803 RepID=A0A9P0YFM0_CUSEU|nr:unnamed protein product [Cuscuta europaea]
MVLMRTKMDLWMNELEENQKRLRETLERNQQQMKAMLKMMQATIAKLAEQDQSRSRNKLHPSHTSHRSSHHGNTRSSARADGSEENSKYFVSHQEQKLRKGQGDRSRSRHHPVSQTESQTKSRTSSLSSQSQNPSENSQTSSPAICSHPRKARLRGGSSSSPEDLNCSFSSSKVTSRNSASSKTEELPLFNEDEVYDWIDRMERYFRIQAIAEKFKVNVAEKAMGEAACGWFQWWWEYQKREDSWKALKEDLIRDFPPKHRQKTGRTEKQVSSRSPRTPLSTQVSQLAQEFSQSIKKNQMEPTEPVIKQMNNRDEIKDEIKEKKQVIQWPDYVSTSLVVDVDLIPSQVSIIDPLIQPCSFGNRVLMTSETSTEAQEEEVEIVSGESAIIMGKPLTDSG